MNERPRGTVTFLFTDIEGSTRLWERHPTAMRSALAHHDALLREIVERHGGVVFKTVGDAVQAAFDTAPPAVAAALDAQRELGAEDWGEIGALKVRAALHTGAADQHDGDYQGAVVNRLAHLLAIGHGGQVVLARATAELVGDALPGGASLLDLGEHRLKDLLRPEQVLQLAHPDLPSACPPLRSLDNHPNNLPRQLTSFVGRERGIGEVLGLLESTPLVTLSGPGGAGKTRLALQVAAELADRYADGVWLVELASVAEPCLVPGAIARTVGLVEDGGPSPTDGLARFLQSKSLLLVLDNCEQVVEACARLADRLLRSVPGLKILATSREALGIAGEVVWRVPSLPTPDPRALDASGDDRAIRLSQYEAVRLFIDRALAALPTFAVTNDNAPALAQICHQLDGIPLAIELAAARVRMLTVEQIAGRLDQRFKLLVGGSRTAPTRQQTLRSLIDWSYDLLDDAERMLLRRLAVFAGGWTLEAAEAVCGTMDDGQWTRDERSSCSPSSIVHRPSSAADVLDCLARLVEKSLIQADGQDGETRYRFLETVRQYAEEKLVESGEKEFHRRRHYGWCLELAEQAEPWLWGTGQVEWLARLEREIDNLRAALAWCRSATGEPPADASARAELGVRLAGTLWQFWHSRGYMREGLGVLGALLPETSEPSVARARALISFGWLPFFLGEPIGTDDALDRALALSRALDFQRGVGLALVGQGMVLLSRGDPAGAGPLWGQALDVARRTDDPVLTWVALYWLGEAARFPADYERARALLEEGLAAARALGDHWGSAALAGNLARVAVYQGDFERAEQVCREAIVQHQEAGQNRAILFILEVLAWAAAGTGDARLAARLFGVAEAARERVGALLMMGERDEHERAVAGVAAQLGETELLAAWTEGRALSLDRAVALGP